MKKKSSFIMSVVVILYAAAFFIIMTYAFLTPARVYDNLGLLAKNQSSANKINYKLSRHEGTTTVTCEKMQGMDIIWESKADEDMTHQMCYNLDVTSGKAKLILIQSDDTVITLVEQDSNAVETASPSAETLSTERSMTELELKKEPTESRLSAEKGHHFPCLFRCLNNNIS